MAELIVKEVLDNEHIYVIETDGSIHKMIFCGDCDWEERPVTTLAEIRAMAYIQFKEKAYKMFSKYNREYGYPSLAECEIVLQEVVEQLKEET